MRIAEMSWEQVEAYLLDDDRCVVPLGSTEQHGPLSLATDAILAEKVAADAAEPLGVPVFPVLYYGVSPQFTAYPGTVSLSVETYARLVGELLDNLHRSGFRRILLVSGHGGNAPAGAVAREWMTSHPDAWVRFHEWWKAPRTHATVLEIDRTFGHASWMENFPWTRLEGAAYPDSPKTMVEMQGLRSLHPAEIREVLGDGNFGGDYIKPDEVMERLWTVGVEETREALEGPWG